MREHAAGLAARFREVGDAVVSFAQECPVDGWRRLVPHEGRTIGFLFNHIADGYAVQRRALAATVTGQHGPSFTWEDLNARNVRRWEELPFPDQIETIVRLRAEAEQTAAAVAALTDEQLTMSIKYGPFPKMSVKEFVERSVIRHPDMHVLGMRQEFSTSSHG